MSNDNHTPDRERGRRAAGRYGRSSSSERADTGADAGAPTTGSTGEILDSSTRPKHGRRAAARVGKNGKAKRTGWKRFIPTWKGLAWTGAGLFVSGVAVVGIAYAKTPIPDANALINAQTSIIYWNDGTTEMDRIAERNRITVDLNQIPEHVREAVIAAEDRSFYDNSGISPTGIARAFWNNLRGGSTQGGSTITQQYVKNAYLTQERTFTRKIKEVFVAIKVDQEVDKDTILQDYLNTIYFGRGAYGIETAAQAYYGKSVKDLTVEEGAALASVIRSPKLYDPRFGPEAQSRLDARFKYTLDGLAEAGVIDEAQATAAVLPPMIEYVEKASAQGQQYYMVEAAKKELLDSGKITEEDLLTGGLRITTTFDAKAQAAAVAAMAEMPTEGRPTALDANGQPVSAFHAALAAVRPGTGEVVAIYGGAGITNDGVKENDQFFDDAMEGLTQAGSTFKPFALVGTLKSDISLKSRYDGSSPKQFPYEGWNDDDGLRNYGGSQYGMIDLVKATQSSVNTVYAQLSIDLQEGAGVADAAVLAGIPDDEELHKGPAIVLGTAPIHPVDLANAYATFAAQGQHAPRHVVAKVTNASGQVLYEGDTQAQQVFEPDVMADTTYALQQVIKGGSGTAAKSLGRPAAGKTGTTQLNVGTLFAGYTPQLSAVVAMWAQGNDADGDPISLNGLGGKSQVTGGAFATPIWTTFMKAALDGMEEADFPERANVGTDVNPEPTALEVPNVTGMSADQAKATLEQLGFVVAFADQPVNDRGQDGKVVGVSPGGPQLPGTTITLAVGRFKQQEQRAPDVRGKTRAEAEIELQVAGFSVSVEERDVQRPDRVGIVLDQNQNGSSVTIVVGRQQQPGPDPSPTTSPSPPAQQQPPPT